MHREHPAISHVAKVRKSLLLMEQRILRFQLYGQTTKRQRYSSRLSRSSPLPVLARVCHFSNTAILLVPCRVPPPANSVSWYSNTRNKLKGIETFFAREELRRCVILPFTHTLSPSLAYPLAYTVSHLASVRFPRIFVNAGNNVLERSNRSTKIAVVQSGCIGFINPFATIVGDSHQKYTHSSNHFTFWNGILFEFSGDISTRAYRMFFAACVFFFFFFLSFADDIPWNISHPVPSFSKWGEILATSPAPLL